MAAVTIDTFVTRRGSQHLESSALEVPADVGEQYRIVVDRRIEPVIMKKSALERPKARDAA